jgi:diadenosine tetraphosphate (Ap4A) HIT family hydrolase
MTAAFTLHPKLAEDCIDLGSFPVCRLLLMNDATYPWFVLVPQRADLVELYDLEDTDLQAVMGEVTALARAVNDAFDADKMNVAQLGNLVPQLHIHVIARRHSDPAWPRPIWGVIAGTPYPEAGIDTVRATLLPHLSGFESA